MQCSVASVGAVRDLPSASQDTSYVTFAQVRLSSLVGVHDASHERPSVDCYRWFCWSWSIRLGLNDRQMFLRLCWLFVSMFLRITRWQLLFLDLCTEVFSEHQGSCSMSVSECTLNLIQYRDTHVPWLLLHFFAEHDFTVDMKFDAAHIQ